MEVEHGPEDALRSPGGSGRIHHGGAHLLIGDVDHRLGVDRYLRGGDQRSFNEEGFAAVRFTEWREDYNHQHQTVRTENGIQYGDLIEFDDFGYMAQVARLNAATLATLARAPGSPNNVRMMTRDLGNSSVIVWESPDGAPADTLLCRHAGNPSA